MRALLAPMQPLRPYQARPFVAGGPPPCLGVRQLPLPSRGAAAWPTRAQPSQ